MSKRKRGRPVKYPMPDPIPDTPENIMKAILRMPPTNKRRWRFMSKRAGRA